VRPGPHAHKRTTGRQAPAHEALLLGAEGHKRRDGLGRGQALGELGALLGHHLAQRGSEALRRERLFTDPAALTAEVVKLMNDRKIAEARKLIREAVQRADAGQSDKLKKEQDSLQFLIAETYYLEGNYQLAATEYNLVRKNFPKSAKVPEALFKMGQCFESLSLPDDAKLFYKTVVEKHAKSDAAKKARERLAALK
jgi:tetratricopeptide (TPR) repeat protein